MRMTAPVDTVKILSDLLAILLLFASLILLVLPASAADLQLGDPASEAACSLDAPLTEVADGALGERCRRILPGGALSFTMPCDPARQNYLTLKLWGSDTEVATLFLFDGDRRIGLYGDQWPELDLGEGEAAFPGRFYYTTYSIPRSMTDGKAQVTLKVAAVGVIAPYAPPGQRERPAQGPSRGIYRAYVHTDPYLVPAADEVQGTAPVGKVRPVPANSPGLAELRAQIDGAVTALLRWQLWGPQWEDALARGDVPAAVTGACARPMRWERRPAQEWKDAVAQRTGDGNATSLNVGAIFATAYASPWSRHHGDPELLQRAAAALDYACRAQGATGGFVSSTWPGGPQRRVVGSCLEGFGTIALGQTILSAPEAMLSDSVLSVAIDDDDDPVTPPVPRRTAWAKMLALHRDYLASPVGRGHATNQDMAQILALWQANEALHILAPDLAWPREKTLPYVYSAVGLAPDVLGGYWVTSKGLCLEPWGTLAGGYCGNYGANCVQELCHLAKVTGDEKVRQRASDAVRAFAYFVFPSVDDEGFLCMRKEDVINTRNTKWPCRVDWGGNISAAALWQDPVALRSLQLFLSQGNLPSVLEERNAHYVDSVNRAILTMGDLERALQQPPSAFRFPMEIDQPDFAWADEQAAAVAIKHNGTRLYMALNWRRGFRDGKRDPQHTQVNNIARIHCTTDTIDRIATIAMESPEGFGRLYLCRYGPYYVAMNLTADTTFHIPGLPARGAVPDLISGETLNLVQGATVAPGTTRVLYLGSGTR
jgi:hypothetical protein